MNVLREGAFVRFHPFHTEKAAACKSQDCNKRLLKSECRVMLQMGQNEWFKVAVTKRSLTLSDFGRNFQYCLALRRHVAVRFLLVLTHLLDQVHKTKQKHEQKAFQSHPKYCFASLPCLSTRVPLGKVAGSAFANLSPFLLFKEQSLGTSICPLISRLLLWNRALLCT